RVVKNSPRTHEDVRIGLIELAAVCGHGSALREFLMKEWGKTTDRPMVHCFLLWPVDGSLVLLVY
ncbi:hypothetical protein HAX54_038882, partial [Datura stramonium]|nr:hypothetical protein [Datura stramonium]